MRAVDSDGAVDMRRAPVADSPQTCSEERDHGSLSCTHVGFSIWR